MVQGFWLGCRSWPTWCNRNKLDNGLRWNCSWPRCIFSSPVHPVSTAVVHQVPYIHQGAHRLPLCCVRYHLLRKKVNRDGPFVYDAFISYAKEDEDWVMVRTFWTMIIDDGESDEIYPHNDYADFMKIIMMTPMLISGSSCSPNGGWRCEALPSHARLSGQKKIVFFINCMVGPLF